MSLLATCMSSLEQCTFMFSAQFLIRLLLIYLLLMALSLSCSILDPLLQCRSFSLAVAPEYTAGLAVACECSVACEVLVS